MTTGAFTTTPLGAFEPGQMGGRRMSWMKSTATDPLFAVMFIDEVSSSYYHHTIGLMEAINVEGRARWYRDVEEYEALAAQMTERDLWKHLILLLIHVESPSLVGTLIPIVPVSVDGRPLPYPSHINPPDSVPLARWRPRDVNASNFDVFRIALEQAGSPVFPRIVYMDESGSMTADSIRPGWSEWASRSPVGIDIRLVDADSPEDSEQWVKWASDILQRVLAIWPP